MNKSLLLVCSTFLTLFSCQEENFRTTEAQILEFAAENDLNIELKSKADITNSLIFDDIESFREFIAETKEKQLEGIQTTETYFKSTSDSQMLGQTLSCEHDGAFGARINAGLGTMNINFTMIDGNLSRLNSYLSGVTLGISWSYGGYSHSQNPDGSSSLNVSGTINYDLFIQGAGTIYRQAVNYRILIACDGSVVVDAQYK